MYYSILFPDREYDYEFHSNIQPEYFKDLCLDQIMDACMKGEDFDLIPLFCTALKEPDEIRYRQEILTDMQNPELHQRIKKFSSYMRRLDRGMSAVKKDFYSNDSFNNNYLTQGTLLNYAEQYCHTLRNFILDMDMLTVASSGLSGFVAYLREYVAGDTFASLCDDICVVREALSAVQYCMLIKNGTISVRKYENQQDEGSQVLALFDKFKQSDGTDYRREFSETPHAEHVEAAVLQMLASKWYPEVFAQLSKFCQNHIGFIDDRIAAFSRESQYYTVWQDYISPLELSGLHFCCPEIQQTKGSIFCDDTFDLALASSLWPQGKAVVNDFVLEQSERIIVITGPNQGGKTTFARTFGQIHHLFGIGLSVPGSAAKLFLFDHILTHFEREEDIKTENGKLQDDLIRLHGLFEKATYNSIIIINEIYSSTTLQDALLLGGRMIDLISDLDAYAVCVTFLDELASHNEKTISMMSTVHEDNPTQRTFKILRQPANGLAYAVHIAQKYDLTYESLKRRIGA